MGVGVSTGFLRAYRRAQKFLQSVPARTDGSYVADQSDGITRLHSTCPTVTPEEVAKLERKRRGLTPVDYEQLPP